RAALLARQERRDGERLGLPGGRIVLEVAAEHVGQQGLGQVTTLGYHRQHAGKGSAARVSRTTLARANREGLACEERTHGGGWVRRRRFQRVGVVEQELAAVGCPIEGQLRPGEPTLVRQVPDLGERCVLIEHLEAVPPALQV